LRYQIGTSSLEHGGRRNRPYVFTEFGVAMLSGILNSQKAIEINIAIIRTFVKIRNSLAINSLNERMDRLEDGTNNAFNFVFQKLQDLEKPMLDPNRKKIGVKEKS
jgi:hypothetical protein